MKRRIAALGALAVGLSGAVVASAPAQAATTPDCDNSSQSGNFAADPAADSFYFDCVPQYGLGKADFVVQNPDGFADEFSLADSADVALSTSLDSEEIATYFSGFPISLAGGAFFDSNPTAESATGQSYAGVPVIAIDSVTKIKASALPSICKSSKVSYDGAYRIRYLPSTITADTTAESGQLVDGNPGKFFFAVRPNELYVGANFTKDENNNSQFDSSAAACWASGRDGSFAVNGTADNQDKWEDISSVAYSLTPSTNLQASALVPIGDPAEVSAAKTVGYGTPALSVKVAGDSTDGVVDSRVDGVSGDTVTIPNGKAKVELPAGLSIGEHEIQLTYSGDKSVDEATRTTTFTVTKGTTVTGLSLSKSKATKNSTRLVASTTVTVPGTSLVASGKVEFSVNGKVVKTVTLKGGKAKGTLPVFSKTGTSKVVAKYIGSSKLKSDSSPSKSVKVSSK